MSNLSTYDSYQDSGTEWLGEIPKNWQFKRMKYLYKDVSLKGRPNAELLSVTQKQGVVPRTWVDTRMVMPSGNLESFKFINEGDFAISLRSFEGGLEYCYHDGIISPAYTVLKCKSESLYKGYYRYLFKSTSFISELQTSIVGIREGKNISFEELSYSLIPIPQREEQIAIAKFLDDKTAKIDQAIDIKEKQIELLKERKQILIQNAVTRGLDPNVPMKDSIIDWIGKIPQHWKVEKLFGLCRFVRGNSAFTKDELLSNGKYVALQYGKTYKVDEVDALYEFYVNEEFYKESQVVNFGDVIFISTSETIEDLGHSAIYNRDEVGLIGGEQLLIKPNNDLLDSYYIYYSTKVFSKELRKYATGIKVFRFNINNLKTIYTVVPPKEEQEKIVRHISIYIKKINQAISLQESQIEKLKEYKSTLINSAVTGKIKVQDVN